MMLLFKDTRLVKPKADCLVRIYGLHSAIEKHLNPKYKNQSQHIQSPEFIDYAANPVYPQDLRSKSSVVTT